MSRLYCEHMAPIDEECEECPPPVDLWECARAWAGLAMWCMCEDASTVMLREHHAWSSAWAWQALRDWLDGTAEEWQARVKLAHVRGEQVALWRKK